MEQKYCSLRKAIADVVLLKNGDGAAILCAWVESPCHLEFQQQLHPTQTEPSALQFSLFPRMHCHVPQTAHTIWHITHSVPPNHHRYPHLKCPRKLASTAVALWSHSQRSMIIIIKTQNPVSMVMKSVPGKVCLLPPPASLFHLLFIDLRSGSR